MFKPVTVASITKSLTNMVSELEALSSKHRSEIEQNNSAIANLSADNALRTAEIARANAVSKKLESLLSN